MDRVAQLAEEAEFHLRRESEEGSPHSRQITLVMMEGFARRLGFPESEIASAIDTALGGR